MIDHSQENPESPEAPKDRGHAGGKRGRRRQAAKWGGILAGSFLLAVVTGAWLAYAKRTSILNSVFEAAAAPYRIVAGRFEIDASGNIDLYDVRLEDHGGTGAVITIPHAAGVIDFRDAIAGKWVSVALERPVIHIPLETIMHSEAPAGLEAIHEEVSSVAPAFTSPRFALEKLTIDAAELMIGDVFVARFDYDADTLALYDDGSIETRRHRLSLQDARFGDAIAADGKVEVEATQWLAIPSAEAEFSVHREGGVVRLHSLDIPKVEITADAALVEWLFASGFGPMYAPPDGGGAPVPASPFSSLIVEQASIEDLQVESRGLGKIPDFDGVLALRCTGLRMPFATDAMAAELRLDELQLQVRDAMAALPDDGGPIARVPEFSMSIGRGDDLAYELRDVNASGMELKLTPEIVAMLTPATVEPTTTQSDAGADNAAPPDNGTTPVPVEVRVVSAMIADASIAVSGFDRATAERSFLVPELTGTFDATLRDVTIAGGDVRSAQVQELLLKDVLARVAGEPELAAIRGAEFAIIPDEFLADETLRRCRIDSPKLRLTEPFWELVERVEKVAVSDDATVEADETLAAAGQVALDDKAPWRAISIENLEVRDGYFKMAQTDSSIPNVEGHIEILTKPGEDGDAPVYQATATDLVFHAPTDLSAPFARAELLEVVVDSAALWSEKRVTSATLRGASLRSGKQFGSLFADTGATVVDVGSGVDKSVPEEPAPPAGEPLTGEVLAAPGEDWRVGTIHVEDSIVIVEDLAPLIPDIPLPVKTSMSDFPLTKQGFNVHEEPLKVEVARIRVPSPYGHSRTPVAELESVFIHFSLGGLMRHEIAKVEVLHPTIYVGENLFWYVEFFRGEEAAEAADKGVAAAAPASGAESRQSDSGSGDEGWSIEQIDAVYGQLIIALSGSVNPDLPAFPFSCSTALNEGTLSAQLDIPGGIYRPLEGVDLAVKVTGGHADFNLPLGQESNNLVEIFRADQLRYKQFLTTDVHLSVTYDQYGIYARFGGETYDGYTDGAFNLYINDDYSWDGWVAGTKVSATEITRVLTPEYYLMSGTGDFKLIAQGDLGSLYQAYGDFSMDAPGIISVPALDTLKGEFPDDWTRLKSSLAETGIGALRDLPYETCHADFKLYEREGTLNLNASGPGGLRDFQLKVRDYRLPSPVKFLELANSNDDVQTEGSVR